MDLAEQQTNAMLMDAPPDLLTAEHSIREGEVPTELDAPLQSTVSYQIAADAFLLRLPNGLRFHYRRGEGTVYARPADVPDGDVALFFDGSVYGAIAWLNGFIPLHASAVAHEGRVFAFTGASGEGKSTLAAALGDRGFTVVSDDVLVVDTGGSTGVMAFPGPARMKLWTDALLLTQRQSNAAVRAGIDKFYVGPELFSTPSWRQIVRLYVLDSFSNQSAEIAPINGAEAFQTVQTAFYRPHFGAAVVDPQTYFVSTARLATDLTLAHFRRSRDKSLFASSLDVLEADIRGRRA